MRGLRNSSWFLPSISLCLFYSLAWSFSPLRSWRNIFENSHQDRLIFNKEVIEDGGHPFVQLYGSPFGEDRGKKSFSASAASYWHDPVLFLEHGEDDETVSASKLSRLFNKEEKQPLQLLRSDLLRIYGSKSAGNKDHHVTFVCEIPRATTAKLEIIKDSTNNPISIDVDVVEDTKSGLMVKKGRHYKWASLTNYGSLPRTYSHPLVPDIYTHRLGDGDPIDALEICPTMEPCESGELYKVRILGALAMRDGNATDWKIISLRDGCFNHPSDELSDITSLGLDTIHVLPSHDLNNKDDAESLNPLMNLEDDIGNDAGDNFNEAFYSTGPIFDNAANDGPLTRSFLYFIRRGIDNGDNRFIDAAKSYFNPLLNSLKVWFKHYKRPIEKYMNGSQEMARLGGTPNKFDLSGKWADASTAYNVVQMHHQNWCLLLLPALQGLSKKIPEIGIDLDSGKDDLRRLQDWKNDCQLYILN